MDGLCYTGYIVKISPIAGADKIVLAEVICGKGGKWRGVVPIDSKKGDMCRVYLPDAIVPSTPEFEFMAKRHYRVSVARFKGAPSECLIMPADPTFFMINPGYQIGMDLTHSYGVTKYEKPMPANLAGVALGNFPAFIPKSDEPNIQNMPHFIDALRGKSYVITLKIDGSSTTAYRWQDHFGVCSRNLELVEGNNAYWNVAKKYSLPEKLSEGYALQYEVYGEGIQKNPVGIKGVDGAMFTVFNIAERRRLNYLEALRFSDSDKLEFPIVDMIHSGNLFHHNLDDLIQEAETAEYPNGKPAEGIVVRPMKPFRTEEGDLVSFKVLNLSYKG